MGFDIDPSSRSPMAPFPLMQSIFDVSGHYSLYIICYDTLLPSLCMAPARLKVCFKARLGLSHLLHVAFQSKATKRACLPAVAVLPGPFLHPRPRRENYSSHMYYLACLLCKWLAMSLISGDRFDILFTPLNPK